MYSNKYPEIRKGFTNYVGAALSSLSLEDREAKQLIVSMLLEESFLISKNDDKEYDLFALKPFFRAFIIIFNDRITQLRKLDIDVDNQIKTYENIIQEVEKLLDSIK